MENSSVAERTGGFSGITHLHGVIHNTRICKKTLYKGSNCVVMLTYKVYKKHDIKCVH